MRRLVAIATLALAGAGASSWAAYGDNCSGLQDCYGSVQSAAAASAGMAVLIALAVLYGPGLLRGLTQSSAPPEVTPPPLRRDAGPKEEKEKEPTDRVEPPESPERLIRYDEKVRADMVTRGWSARIAEATVIQTSRVSAVRDQRFNLDGSREGAPGSAHARSDGWYVVINDLTLDIVQVGGGPLTGWPPARPSGPAWADTPAGRIAAAVGMSQVAFAGPEPCYPIRGAHRAVDYCERHGLRILGMDAFHRTAQALRPRPDLIFDCSSERSEEGRASIPACAARARQVLEQWSGETDLMVSLTIAPNP